MNVRKGFLILGLVLGYLSALAVDEVHKRGNYETPHTKWLSPTPFSKKPRVLFFSFYHSGGGRYANEMAQRFDLNFEVAVTESVNNKAVMIGRDIAAKRMEDLLNQSWDAFVFFDGTPTALLEKYPQLYSMMLFKIARDGAGVILIDYTDEKIFKERNKLDAPASIPQQKPMISTYYKVGNGRGVQIQGFDMNDPKYRSVRGYARKRDALVLDYKEGWRDEYDAMFRNIGENLLWVMHKPLNAIQITKKNQDITVSGGWPSDAKLDLVVAGGGDHLQLLKNAEVGGKKQISVALPDLVPGSYFVNALIRSKDKACTFGSKTLTIPENPSGKIDKIVFTDDNNGGDVGQKIKGTVHFSGKGEVKLRLRDTQRRILSEMPLKEGNGNAPFEFEIEDWMPPMITAEASLYKDGKEISRLYEYCNRTIRRPRMFEFSAWGHPYNQNAVHDVNKRLAEIGLTSLMMWYEPPHSPYGLQPYPIYSAHVYSSIPGDNPNECYLSEAKIKKQTDRFKEREKFCKVGMRLVSLGDEVQEHYGCMAPKCLEAYREFLKKKYKGDLAELNRNWKTSFKNWQEVELSRIPEKNKGRDLGKYVESLMGTTWRAHENHFFVRYAPWSRGHKQSFKFFEELYPTDPRAKKFFDNMFIDQEAGSFLEGNYARWVDRMDFKNEVYCRHTKELVDYFKKIDPYTLAGMEGTGGFDYVGNVGRAAKVNAWTGAYADVNNKRINELIRSITPDDYISNSWVGYTTNPSMLCDRVWNEIFRRPTMIMFWTALGSGLPTYNGILRPDFSFFSAAGEMLRQTKKLREGLGTSLIRSARADDPIAILYSYPSAAFGARIYNGASYDFARLSHDGAINLVNSLGHSFRYITAEQIDEGEIDLKNFKVLLLPRVNAVSDTMKEKINEFVRNGGTVIADIRAGIFTEHLIVRPPGAFDQASGVTRRTLSGAVPSHLKIPGAEKETFLLEGGVALSTGKAQDKSEKGLPAMIVNRYGEGKFLTLNFPFQQFPALSADSSLSKTIEPLFGSLPAHTTFANAETGKKVYNLRRVVWKNGDMRIMGIKNITGGKRACRATLPKEEYVFNLNTEKALGKVSSFDFTIDPPMPEFFILTDRPLPAITCSVPKSAKRGSTISVTYSVRGMKGERPLLLSFEKDGKALDLYTKVEVCANTDKRETRFRIALNDPPGKYAIVARDVYTGGTEKFQLTVE